MVEKLRELMRSGKWIELYHKVDEPSKFLFGRVLCVNEDELAILVVDDNGRYDGISWLPIDMVRYLLSDTKYCRNFETLIASEALPSEVPVLDESNIRDSLLAYARKHCTIISIQVDESDEFDFSGFVTDYRNGLYKFHVVDNYGDSDGVCYVDANRIRFMDYDSSVTNRYFKLWCKKHPKNKKARTLRTIRRVRLFNPSAPSISPHPSQSSQLQLESVCRCSSTPRGPCIPGLRSRAPACG